MEFPCEPFPLSRLAGVTISLREIDRDALPLSSARLKLSKFAASVLLLLDHIYSGRG